jgi:hypothetical protein
MVRLGFSLCFIKVAYVRKISKKEGGGTRSTASLALEERQGLAVEENSNRRGLLPKPKCVNIARFFFSGNKLFTLFTQTEDLKYAFYPTVNINRSVRSSFLKQYR